MAFSGGIALAIILATLMSIVVFKWRKRSLGRRTGSTRQKNRSTRDNKTKDEDFTSTAEFDNAPCKEAGSSESLVDMRSNTNIESLAVETPRNIEVIGNTLCSYEQV